MTSDLKKLMYETAGVELSGDASRIESIHVDGKAPRLLLKLGRWAPPPLGLPQT